MLKIKGAEAATSLNLPAQGTAPRPPAKAERLKRRVATALV
jgi:hypothetical protein